MTLAVPDSVVAEFIDVDQMLGHAARRGIDHLVLSPWIKLVPSDPDADQGEAAHVCAVLNEGLSALAAARQGRISGLGAVPLGDPEAAAACLVNLMKLAGMVGAEVPASIGGLHLGDDGFEPFWAAAQETGALIFVHPTTTGFGLDALKPYYLWNSVGNPMETAVTAAHMIMAGVLERYPALKVLLAHGGGGLHAVRGRLRRAHAVRPEARARCTEGPDVSLRRFWYDSLTHDAALLKDLVDFAGVDHVVLGTDYPFDMGTFDMGAGQPVGDVGALGALGLSLALGRSGARLLGLVQP